MDTLVRFLSEDGLRLALAVLLGGIIGLEREASDKPAGLRTNILICVGSTLMMILSIRVAHDFAVAAADPSRIAQGVITGIGFLGAGTILHSRGGVTGLTTAATTWAVAGIGLALGSGFYLLAFTSAILILGVLVVLGRVAHVWPNGKPARWSVRVIAEEPASRLDDLRMLLDREGVVVSAWSYRRLRDGHSVLIECDAARAALPRLLSLISAAPGIRSVKSL
ncbi:MAG TPA: MgtC/SapB family protein [Candidatus Polarisedimenticolia bacterium]|jgi:putative Mg2+ transporter-C (MgtC) family protein